jgi:hypothetical protein
MSMTDLPTTRQDNADATVESWKTLPPERLEKEYLDLSQNIRHYGNLRFAQLTLFAAITAGLVKVAIENAHEWPVPLRTALYTAGALVAASFWVMEERGADYWHHFRRRADKIEPFLHFGQYSTKKPKVVSATNAVRFLFIMAILAWVASIVQVFIG